MTTNTTDGKSDALYDQAVALVRQHGKGSISLVQRHLNIGYNRAAKMLDAMVGTVLAGPAPTDKLLPAMPQPRSALTLDRPVTFGGCPFCGSQQCVAGQCQRAAPDALRSQAIPLSDDQRKLLSVSGPVEIGGAPEAAKPEPCKNTSLGEHACKNRHQCWEPCGELGKSGAHVKVHQPEQQARTEDPDVVARVENVARTVGSEVKTPTLVLIKEVPANAELITLQSHHEILDRAIRANIEAKQMWDMLKTDYDALVVAAERAKSALVEAIMIAPLTSIPPSAAAAIQGLDAAINRTNGENSSPIGFPKRIMDLLNDVADRNGTPTRGPWEDGNGDPLQDDADAAIAWIAAHSTGNK